MLDLEVAFNEDPWERKTIRLLAARNFLEASVQLKRKDERALLVTNSMLDVIPMLGSHVLPHNHFDVVVDDDDAAMDMFEMFDEVLGEGPQPKVIIEDPFAYLDEHKQKKYHYIFWFPDHDPSDLNIGAQMGAATTCLSDVGVLFVSYPMKRIDGLLQRAIDRILESRDSFPSLLAVRQYSDGDVLDAFVRLFEQFNEKMPAFDERLRQARNLLNRWDRGEVLSKEDLSYYRQYILESADRADQFARSPWAACLLSLYEGTGGRVSLLGRRAWSVGSEGKGFFGALFQMNRALPGSSVKKHAQRFQRMRREGGFQATHEEDPRKGFAQLLSMSTLLGNTAANRTRVLSCISIEQLDELKKLIETDKEEETAWTLLSSIDSGRTSSKEPQLPRSKVLDSTLLGSAIFASTDSRK